MSSRATAGHSRRRVLAGLTVFALAAGTGIHAQVQRAVARPGPQATVIWKVNTRAWGRVAADTTMAFFLSGQHEVTAVEAATGAVRWKQNTGEPDPVSGNGIVLAGDTVVAGDYNITAYDRSSGARKWRFVPAVGFGPGASLGTVTNGVVFAGSNAGRVYAIDLSSGALRWSALLASDTRTLVPDPVVEGDLVYVGYTTMTAPTVGGVVVLDAETGAERWRAPLEGPAGSLVPGGSAGSPLLVNDLLVIANRAGSIHAFRRSDGTPAWTIDALNLPVIFNSPIPQPPGPRPDYRALAWRGSTLFAGSATGYVMAYDLATRRERWRFLGAQNGSIGFQMISDERAVYVPAWSGRLTAVNIDNGSERWRIGDGLNNFLWPPALVGDVAYAAAFGGFYALRR